jgi:hypothetical protein
MFLLFPVWLGLLLTWNEKDKKSLKELLIAWTCNCLLTSFVFILLFGLPLVIGGAGPRSPSVAYTPFLLIRNFVLLFLLGFSVYWVIGAICTLFIWAIRKE